MSARRTENRGRDRAQHQPANWRRSRVYASRVRPRYPARNPASASRSASVKAGWMVARAVEEVVAVSRAPPGTAGTWDAGPPQALAMNDSRNVWHPSRASYTTVVVDAPSRPRPNAPYRRLGAQVWGVIRITPQEQRYASASALACGSRLAMMQGVIFKVAVRPASLLPVQTASAQTRRMGRRARCGFRGSGRAASRFRRRWR